MSNYNYSLPKILTQKSQSCSSYAVAGICNWKFFNQGIALEVDADKLYAETTPKGEGQTLGSVLRYCQNTGMPLLNGNRVKIKSYERIMPAWVNAEQVLAEGPAVFTMKIPTGATLDEQVKPPDYLFDKLFQSHSLALVGCDAGKKRFKVANSKSVKFGMEGYFFIPYMLFTSMYIVDFYTFTL